MKKNLLAIAFMLAVVTVNAAQFQNFRLNENGECIIVRTFQVKNTSFNLMQLVKTRLSDNCLNPVQWNQSEDGTEASFIFSFQTEAKFNPFAGNFNKFLQGEGTVFIENGNVVITLSNLTLVEHYFGYGESETRHLVDARLLDIENDEKAIADGTLDKKALKQAKKELEDYIDLLTETDEELTKRLNQLKKKLGA